MTERYRAALDFATKKHDGQWRKGGAAYITHPVAVAEYLAQDGMDEDTQIAGLFHDLLEDTDATEAEILALLKLPDGIDAFVDLAGDEIPKSGRIAAGAYQRSIDLTGYSGDIVVLSRLEVDGYRQASTKTYMHCRTPGGPRPVCLKPILTEGLELIGCSAPGVVGNALFPQMNGEIWTMTPPEGTVISNKPYYTTRIYYVNPDPERGSDENAGTSADAPLFTIQAALSKITDNNGAVVHCAPGVYTNGSSSSSRFCVSREYVRITGAGRDLSFVYGQKAAGTEEQEDGRGTDALRCVSADDRHSCVQGFTLANGYTRAGSDNTSSRQGGIVYTSGDLFQVQDCTLSNGWAARGSVGYKGVYRRCLITRQNESAAVGTHFREAEAILSCLYVDNDGSAVDQPFFTDSASYGRMICQSSLVGNANKAVFNENYKVRNTLVGPSATIKATDVDGSLKTSSFSWSGVSTVTGGSYAGVAQGDYRLISTSSAVSYGVTPDYVWYTTDFTGKPFSSFTITSFVSKASRFANRPARRNRLRRSTCVTSKPFPIPPYTVSPSQSPILALWRMFSGH